MLERFRYARQTLAAYQDKRDFGLMLAAQTTTYLMSYSYAGSAGPIHLRGRALTYRVDRETRANVMLNGGW